MDVSPVATARVWVAGPGDAADVARLLIAFRDHMHMTWPPDDLFHSGAERLLADPDSEFLLAAPAGDGEPPAGIAQLRFRWGIWRAGGDLLIEDVFVEERARGAGLGRALVAGALDRARARGCRRAELDVNERNEAALALYGAFGFSATENHYGGRDIYMRLHLDGGD
jgi:GNAT superfamily N-acetyltransferase